MFPNPSFIPYDYDLRFMPQGGRENEALFQGDYQDSYVLLTACSPGELAFEKGDIIKVVDRGYKDWWRGQLKGRTGIFPVNYVVRVQC